PGVQTKSYALSYNVYNGGGTPPASASRGYTFRSVTGGLDPASSGSHPGDPGGGTTTAEAVVQIANGSTVTLGYKFRWNSTSSWTSYVLGPGQYRYTWTPASGSVAPQIQFDS